MTETEKQFEDFLYAMTKPRIYGEKYLSAETSDDLLLSLGEACCIAAFSIVKIFGLPRRGALILRIIKVFSKKSYDRYLYLYNFTFSHCLIYITRKMRKTIELEIGPQAEDIAKRAYVYGGSYLGFILRYSQEDNDALLHEIKKRLEDYPGRKIIDEEILLKNIIDGIGRKIRPEQIAIFFRETIAHDPLYGVEPFRFCERYVSLKI